MPLPLPSRSNGYTVSSDNLLDPATLNAVFGDLHQRLLDREGLEASFEGLIVEGTAAAITAIQVGIQPHLEPLVDQLQNLLLQVSQAQDALLAIQQGVVFASMVQETANRVFVTPAQKAEIASLRNDVNGLLADIDGGLVA